MNSSSPGLSKVAGTSQNVPSKRWKPIAISLLLLGAFALILFTVLGDQLRPGIQVEVTRALLLPGTTASAPTSAGRQEVLFQSSGWVEPDPWSTNVAALANGIVRKVYFKEGDLVQKDQLLVEMISEDSDLDLQNAEARLAQAEADCEAHAAMTQVAEQKVVQARLRVEQQKAALEEAKDRWHRVRDLTNLEVSDSIKVEAEQRYNQQVALLHVSQSNLEQALADLERQRHQEIAHNRFKDAMKVARDTAQLQKDRMTIRSPMNGRVKKRFVEPGSKRMRAMDDPDSAIVAEIYDPENVQVRVDVPLAEAGNLAVGQSASISTALLPGQKFDGEVTSIVGMADIQRNTLQAKVRINDPDPRLRPETLCRVAFYPPTIDETNQDAGSNPTSVWIPSTLVEGNQDEATLWIVSPLDNTVSSRTLTLGQGNRDGLQEIIKGLRPNELIVTESESSLDDGARVNIEEKAE